MKVDRKTEDLPVKCAVVMSMGNDVSTDAIYPGRFMATVLPTETPQYAFADHPAFRTYLKEGKMPAGSAIVAGANFGCGSSREQAVSCLCGHELTVVARSFARIFLQNAISLGLRVVACPEIEAAEGDQLEIGPDYVFNMSSGKRFAVKPFSPTKQAVMDAGGLIPYTRQRLAAVRS